MLRHSIKWPHDIWISEKLKSHSQDRKELSKRNEKRFSSFKKCCLLDFQTGKNIADTTFKATVDISIWIKWDKSITNKTKIIIIILFIYK